MDKNHSHVVDMLVDDSRLELSKKHVSAVISHLTQSGVNNLADGGRAVTIALDTLRPRLGLWLLRQKIQDLEKAGNHKELIEKILATAVKRGAVAVVEFLVKHSSVSVNILDQKEPLLIIAADMIPSPSTAGYVDIVRFLLSRSCDVNVKGSSGNTALARACDRGNQAMVEVLLSHAEVEVNKAGEDDLTPLLCAARSGSNAVVDLLLARQDIQVNLRGSAENPDIRGKSALILAGELGHQDIVRSLVKHPGLEINLKDEDGYSGLIWAADNGHQEAVWEFLQHPLLQVNAVDLDGHSALTWAADRGHTEIVTLLLDHGELDVNVRDLEGFTPLICAANQGHRKVVKLLLADPRTDVNLQVKRVLLACVFSLRLFHWGIFPLYLCLYGIGEMASATSES